MGRKTFDSLPAPLPGRRHIVLTRDRGWRAEGAEVAAFARRGIAIAPGTARCSSSAGRKFTRQAMPRATRVEMTEIHADYDGDTFMPPLPLDEWREIARRAIPQPMVARPSLSSHIGGGHEMARSSRTIPDALRGAIVALGNFDGFHLGHQAVAGEAIRWAREEGRPAIVATFDPHPVRHFKPDVPPFRLTTLEQRQELYLAAGATAMLVFHFDAALAGTSARDYVSEILSRAAGRRGRRYGGGFHLRQGSRRQSRRAARDRCGTWHRGSRTSIRCTMTVRSYPPAGSARPCAKATRKPPPLAHPPLRHSRHRGTRRQARAHHRLSHREPVRRKLSAPQIRHLRRDRRILATGQELKGAANIGIRPQFEPPKELLEPYFFDFSGDLYGQEIEVAFHHFLRGEAKFDTLDELTAQMEKDCDRARDLLGARSP